MNAKILARPEKLPWQDRWAGALFWFWNIIFMAFMFLGFGPVLIPALVVSVQTGVIGWQVLAYAVVLALIPAITMIIGFFRLRGENRRLLALGYVVEGPLMLMLAVRFFAVRQSSTGLNFLMIVAGLGMAAFLWRILDTRPSDHPFPLEAARLFGLSLMALVSLYAAAWIGFYALPGAHYLLEFIRSLADSMRYFFGDMASLLRNLIWAPFYLIGFVLVIFTAALFILAPAAVPILSLSAWAKSVKSLLKHHLGWTAVAFSSLASLGVVILFIFANRQPQIKIFSLLQSPPQTPAAAQALLQQSDAIRSGLLNAYLAPFRYIGSVGEINHVSEMYKNAFHVSEQTAKKIQGAYEWVARPLLYQPYEATGSGNFAANQPRFAFEREPAQAARLYQRVFDQTIVEGERSVILAAARSTWSNVQAESALQTLDERQVHLDRQEITVQEHGDWAEIELYEVYRNTTADRQEVIYYFSLPESAVITGVWLGDSPDRASRHAYIVAPRGAAQAVYREQVRRSMDPALIEQIGPRQYRLRIFPVPPIQQFFDERSIVPTLGDAQPLHFWMTWKTLSSEQRWPLPRLSLKRNVYWDADTIRLINNAPSQTIDAAAWMYPFIEPFAPISLEAHQAQLAGGYIVRAEPASQADQFHLPDGVRLAVVVDRSRSMQELEALAGQAVTQLSKLAMAQIDLYLTASPYRGEDPVMVSLPEISVPALEFLGGQNPAQLLVQFAELRAGRQYDAVIVLTDGSGYELGSSAYDLPSFEMPVWMVHIGDRIPIGYDDKTLEAIQSSRGGIVGSLDEALDRIAAGLAVPGVEDTYLSPDVIDGYVWTIQTQKPALAAPSSNGFSSLAARRVILAEMQRQRAQLDDPRTLDQLHSIATGESIVTPYSSMIVLVNAEQERLLRELSKLDDRYQREVEDLGNTSPATQTPLTGVPEPEEWLLIAMALLLLAYALISRRPNGMVWRRTGS